MRTPHPLRLAASLVSFVLVAALTACGGGGTSSSSGRSSASDTPRGPGTAELLPADTKEFMESSLRLFSSGDPAWESARSQWLALGDREASFLVTLLWAALLRSQSLAAGDLVVRARHELALIGGPAVTLMGEMLAGGEAYSFRDDIADETRTVRIDDSARREAAEVLALVGHTAVPTLEWALGSSQTKSGRKFALTALGNMGARGGDDATRAILSALDDADWVLRVEAVHALRTGDDAAGRVALERALSDPESLVREKAADSLAARVSIESVPALRTAEDIARNDGRIGEARRFGRAVLIIERADEMRRKAAERVLEKSDR